jgi:TRAP-type mannitol/chloroaromatic compound transport system permease small subunit
VINYLCQAVDTLNQWTGKIFSPMILFITALVTADVTLRYFFNSPILWAWDLNIQLFGTFTIIGGGFTLLHDGHIGVDAISMRWSGKTSAIVRIITFPFFFVAIGILLWQTTAAAWDSLLSKENYSSYIAPPIYPYKIVMVIGILLLLLQGIVKFIRDIISILPEKRN